MSSFIEFENGGGSGSDSKVIVNSNPTPRQLNFIGNGVTVSENVVTNSFDITITGASVGSGEANTSSNAGVDGIGIVLPKSGVNLPFKAINTGSSKISITDDTTDHTVDIDVVESNLNINNQAGNIGNSRITDLAYSKLTSVPGTLVQTNQTNTFSSNDQIIPSGNFKLSNSGFTTSIVTGTLGGNVVITLPNSTSTLITSTDSRLSDARTPTAHSSTHQSAGSDSISLDTLAPPTDIVTLNADTGKHGLLKKLSNVSTQYMDGTGNWSIPATGSGEANTYSNAGVDGIGITLTKAGVNLPFKAINVGSSKLSITDDTSDKTVDLDVVEANLNIANQTGSIGDSRITDLAYTKLTSVPTTIVKTGQANTYGSFDQIIPSTNLKLSNSGFNATISVGTLGGAVTLTLPSTTDTIVGRATTDTLINKTLTSPTISTILNTGTLTLPTSTDTLVGQATTDTLLNKTLTAPVISTISNTGTLTLPTSTDTLVGRSTTDNVINKSIDSESNSITHVINMPSVRRFGYWVPGASNLSASGLLSAASNSGTVTTAFDATENLVTTFTTGTISGNPAYAHQYNSGTANPIGCGRRAFTNARLMVYKTKIKISSSTSSRMYAGFTSLQTPTAGDTPLGTADNGLLVGFSNTTANFSAWSNNGGGSAALVTTLTGSVPKDANWHAIEIIFNGTTDATVILDGVTTTISSQLPASTANLFVMSYGETATSSARVLSFKYGQVEAF